MYIYRARNYILTNTTNISKFFMRRHENSVLTKAIKTKDTSNLTLYLANDEPFKLIGNRFYSLSLRIVVCYQTGSEVITIDGESISIMFPDNNEEVSAIIHYAIGNNKPW